MLDFVVAVSAVFMSPVYWVVAFLAQMLFQYFLAQRLRHNHAWFAFLPLLNLIQWFQLGRVSALNLLWLFVPILGWFILFPYKYIRGTINVCERAGERGSYSILFLLPVVRIGALIRLALKGGFWVKTSTEAKVIEKIIKGLDSKHSIDDLRKFALKHGISLEDFETGADKAQTIKNNSLKLSHEKYSLPVGFNFSVLVLVVLFYVLLMLGGFKNKVEGLGGFLAENPLQVAVEVPSEPEFVLPPEAENFVSILRVLSEQADLESVFYEGAVVKGDFEVQTGDWVYALNEDFELLEALLVQTGEAAPLDYKVQTRVGLESVAFLVETAELKTQNEAPVDPEVLNQPIIVITDHDESLTARNREILATIYRDSLNSTDPLYVYDAQLELVNAAKIKYLIPPSRNAVERVAPGTEVELVLEFARDYSTKSAYLSTVKDINDLKDYLRLMDL